MSKPPKYAKGLVVHPGETRAPDLRAVKLGGHDTAYVRVGMPLTPGCPVALLYRNKRFKPKLGLYWPGEPEQFAEYVDPWDAGTTKPARPISSVAWPVPLVGMGHAAGITVDATKKGAKVDSSCKKKPRRRGRRGRPV